MPLFSFFLSFFLLANAGGVEDVFFFFFKSDMETRDEQEAYLFFQINEM